MNGKARDVLEFWFDKTPTQYWFQHNSDVQEKISNTFGSMINDAILGHCFEWRENSRGRLAEVLLVDHLSLYIKHKHPIEFRLLQNSLAVVLAQEAILTQALEELSNSKRQFVFLPFIRSESMLIQKSVAQYITPDMEFLLQLHEKAISNLTRFGRFPERNQALNRESNPEEDKYLKLESSDLDKLIWS